MPDPSLKRYVKKVAAALMARRHSENSSHMLIDRELALVQQGLRENMSARTCARKVETAALFANAGM